MLPRPSQRLIPLIAGAFVLMNVDAAIACSTKDKAYVTAMKSDLRNLIGAQDEFRLQHKRYAGSVTELGSFRKSTGVKDIEITTFPEGFYARASHTQIDVVCGIFVGKAPRLAELPNAVNGEPSCPGGSSDRSTSDRRMRGSYAASDSLSILLVVLTAVTLLFLRAKGRRNWPAVVLTGVTLFHVLTPSCGPPPYDGLAVVAFLGLGAFTLALRRALALSAPQTA